MSRPRNECIGLLFILTLLFIAPGVGRAQPQKTHGTTLVMTHIRPRNQSVGCWLLHVYTTAFKRLGYHMKYLYLPAARATIAATQGQTDGELGRTEYYGLRHPELVRVEEPHLVVNFCAYTDRGDVKELDWKKLKNSHLSIVYLRGLQRMERKLRSWGSERVQLLNSEASGLRMVATHRFDVLIGTEPGVDKILNREEFRHSGIRKVGCLESHRAHAYLNRRHAELAKPLSKVLRDMKKQGLLKAYAKECNVDY